MFRPRLRGFKFLCQKTMEILNKNAGLVCNYEALEVLRKHYPQQNQAYKELKKDKDLVNVLWIKERVRTLVCVVGLGWVGWGGWCAGPLHPHLCVACVWCLVCAFGCATDMPLVRLVECAQCQLHFRHSPASTQNVHIAQRLVEALTPYHLTSAEILQILNCRPTSIATLHPVRVGVHLRLCGMSSSPSACPCLLMCFCVCECRRMYHQLIEHYEERLTDTQGDDLLAIIHSILPRPLHVASGVASDAPEIEIEVSAPKVKFLLATDDMMMGDSGGNDSGAGAAED